MRIGQRFFAVAGIAAAGLLTLAAVAYAVTTGTGERPMTGVVVAGSHIALDVPAQPGASGTLQVADVRVPGPSWIVVHLDDNGKPGMRIGLQHVSAGETVSVKVPLKGE